MAYFSLYFDGNERCLGDPIAFKLVVKFRLSWKL